jgi:hypothetical protein
MGIQMSSGRIVRFVVFIVVGIVWAIPSSAQHKQHIADPALGVAFDSPGPVEKAGDSYRIVLPSSNSPNTVKVSVSDRLFVDLPGSYGGRLMTDKPSSRLNDRVMIDSTGGFRREYWVVYAGMGMWEGVINCYRQEGGRYYIVSLARTAQLGKPGEEVEGRPLDGNELRSRFFTSLRDTTDADVREFNTLLSSVEVIRQ